MMFKSGRKKLWSFVQLAFLTKSVYIHHMLENPIGLFTRFLCQPLWGLPGVCGLEERGTACRSE
jgi:hypothetical protein